MYAIRSYYVPGGIAAGHSGGEGSPCLSRLYIHGVVPHHQAVLRRRAGKGQGTVQVIRVGLDQRDVFTGQQAGAEVHDVRKYGQHGPAAVAGDDAYGNAFAAQPSQHCSCPAGR